MENMSRLRQNMNDFLEEAELLQYAEKFRNALKITKISQLKFVVTEDLKFIGLSKPEQRRYKKIYSKYFPNTYIHKIRRLLRPHKRNASSSQDQDHSSIPMEFQPFNDNNVKVPTKHIISIEDITINKELGKGQFGVVQQGTWTTGNQRLQVAIKCLGQERMTSNSNEFLKEAAVMHSIEHPNIVRLYGVVLHSDSQMLVTELAPLRSLLECLREVSLRPDFLVPNLCEFAEQICDGMAYLENKRLIHRDLAARNILVFSKDRVKISDFGLSRALGVGQDYYQTNYNVNLKLPVAWCAPECILFLRFTSSSDVWAFAVCLWEMFTFGFQPWAGFSGQQILEAIDSPNFQRLERPQCCPVAYYSVMLECWSHEQGNRPKFRELGSKLRSIRPEQVQAMGSCSKSEEGRRSNLLEYKAGQIITVLGKEGITRSHLWYGVLPGGACGMFDPTHTKPYVPPEKCLTPVPLLSSNSTRQSSRSLGSSLLRCDVKRHTYTGKRTIQRSMISSPQGDVKHTSHVGLDGAYFGDISFLDPAGCPPRQVVTPYRPSEDLEQVPLINPNSPSHLTGATGTTPYPMLASNISDRPIRKDVHMKGDRRSGRKGTTRSHSESTASSKSILSKVKNATLCRAYRPETGAIPKTVEVHEYHEISDNDAADGATAKQAMKTDCFEATNSADFSQSLIDEMETLFRNLDTKKREETTTSMKNADGTMTKRSQTLTKLEKKRSSPTSTMKLMSAHEEKTLNTAVALANEITSKSMNDLDTEKGKHPQSPSDRHKFQFKLPLSLHAHHSQEPEREKVNTGKQERRNFSEEAKCVPDIQSTLTEESKMAYTSLIEEPSASNSLISHIPKESSSKLKPSTMPSHVLDQAHMNFQSLRYNMNNKRSQANRDDEFQQYSDNPLPLPPRTTKPKLVDKPRHIRKYPLKIPGESSPTVEPSEPTPSIYQNTNHANRRDQIVPSMSLDVDIDVHDGPDKGAARCEQDTNPFLHAQATNIPESTPDLVIPCCSGVNPFKSYTYDVDDDLGMDLDLEDTSDNSDDETDNIGGLVKDCKDHVSVEDLLEFADQKPCGRQRGVESDEVRIMNKVFQQQVSPEKCLEALELSDWNVYVAIKLIRVSVFVGIHVSLEDCSSELSKAKGDIHKASAVLVMCNQNT